MPKFFGASLLAVASSHRIRQEDHVVSHTVDVDYGAAVSHTVDVANMTEGPDTVQFAWAEPVEGKRKRKVYRIVSLSEHPDIGGKCVTTYDGNTRGMYYDTCTLDNDLQEFYFEEGYIKSFRTDQCVRRTMKGAVGALGWAAEVAPCRNLNKCYWYVSSDGAILDAGNILKKPKMKEMSYKDLPVNKALTHCLTAGTATTGLAVASCGVFPDFLPTHMQKWQFVQVGGPEDPFDGDIELDPHWEKVLEIPANPYTFTSTAKWSSNSELTTSKSFVKKVTTTLGVKGAAIANVPMTPSLSASISSSITATTNTVQKTATSESMAQSQTKVYTDHEGDIIWQWVLGIELPKNKVSFKTQHQKVLPRGQYPKCQPLRFGDGDECILGAEEEIPCHKSQCIQRGQ